MESFSVPKLDEGAAMAAQERLLRLTKPPGSLGELESLIVRLAAMQGRPIPTISHKAMVIMAADHGVTAEGVSLFPAAVTRQMIHNFLHGGAAINVLARQIGLDLYIADVGVAGDVALPDAAAARLLHHKVRYGTGNMVNERAMARDEAERAIAAGRAVARTVLKTGVDIIGVGEMGIGNTTSSAAIISFLLRKPPARVTGAGAGLDARGVAHKAAVIEKALAYHKPRPGDPIGLLSAVGGLEIAALAGCMLEAAHHRCPVVIDGLITGAAALIAEALQPGVRHYLIAAHQSAEPGHRYVLQKLQLRPLLHLDMRLGEGSGAGVAFAVIDAAVALMEDMATFDEARVSNVTRESRTWRPDLVDTPNHEESKGEGTGIKR